MTSSPSQLEPVSAAEAAVLRIAQRETLREYAAEFEPITRGFLFAVVALGALGLMAALCMAWRKVQALFGGTEATR